MQFLRPFVHLIQILTFLFSCSHHLRTSGNQLAETGQVPQATDRGPVLNNNLCRES